MGLERTRSLSSTGLNKTFLALKRSVLRTEGEKRGRCVFQCCMLQEAFFGRTVHIHHIFGGFPAKSIVYTPHIHGSDNPTHFLILRKAKLQWLRTA